MGGPVQQGGICKDVGMLEDVEDDGCEMQCWTQWLSHVYRDP